MAFRRTRRHAMTNGVRLYIEGGGDKSSKQDLRLAFGKFFSDPKRLAGEKQLKWDVKMCGDRRQTQKEFVNAVDDHPDAFCVLLVDAEGPVSSSPSAHLRGRDGWRIALPEEHLHLMVQMMEAWFLADPEALGKYYGNRFNAKAIGQVRDVEAIPKADVQTRLVKATKDTLGGKYHKTRHGPAVLERINPQRVRERSTHCQRLFAVLQQEIEGAA